MRDLIHKGWLSIVVYLFFGLMTAWWVVLFLSGTHETPQHFLFAATYGLICIWGGFWGIATSRKWGGFSSTLGKSIIFLSLGLLAQEFGQLVFSYYNVILKVEVPYPSLADIGFFGSIPCYAIGMYFLAKAAGSKFTLNFINKLQVILVPVVMVGVSYLVFLRDYQIDFSNLLKLFLDFGYPIGEAIYISVAILAYSLSRKILGGVMKSRILLLIAAFFVQYVADFNFLYQNNHNTWLNGGYGDYIYFFAYFLMTLGLIQLKVVLDKLD